MAKTQEKIILGIDPGTNIMGYGVVELRDKNPVYIDMGIIDMRKTRDPYKSLQIIFRETIKLLDIYCPDELAIEAPFFGKNVQSMLKLGRAQGVAISAGLSRDIPIFEFAPRKIKMSITGRGSASKEQVAAMLSNILKIDLSPKNLDATDGLAAAVCRCFQGSSKIPVSHTNGWKEFIRLNPERVG
jgi:crossover junction endodeoxyribonuclease RuvC